MITAIGELSSKNNDLFFKMWKTSVDPATRMFQDHRHVNFEIAMVLSGEGIYHTVNGLLPIRPGDVFVFPSNEPHYIMEIHQAGLQIVNLHFNHQFFLSACTISQRYPNLFFAHSDSFPSRICAQENESLRILLMQIQRELSQQMAEYEAVVHSVLNLIFTELVRQHNYYRPQDGVHTSIEKIINGLSFINEHYCENITLKQIADQCGLSPNYFTSLFKAHFHIKLWDYVMSKRIDKAKMLLSRDSDLTIMEIALSCGFNNTANFNKAFLSFTGTIPSQYRAHREKLLH